MQQQFQHKPQQPQFQHQRPQQPHQNTPTKGVMNGNGRGYSVTSTPNRPANNQHTPQPKHTPQQHSQHNQHKPQQPQHQQRPATAPAQRPVTNGTSPAAPQTGRYVSYGVGAGSEPMDVDELLAGTSVLPRTIAFRKSASTFSSVSTAPLQNGHAATNGFSHSSKPQMNGTSPHSKQQQQPSSPTMHLQFNVKNVKQRSPALKPSAHPFTQGSTQKTANGIPIVHDKDPNSFRWPKRYLYPSSTVQALLPWQQFEKIGGGLYNMGNTCFLNAVLQALCYTPPLANFLRRGEHSKQCRVRGPHTPDQFCLFCALEVTVKKMGSHKAPAVQPREVVSHLRSISRSFRLGRQEDSHEFLRFVMDMLQANDLASYGGSKKITDMRVQETTALFGIFGGYFRSQVKCLTCNYRSNTYDAFLDLSLEVSEASSVTKALQSFTRPEKLDAENLYRCSRCEKKVRAEKQLSIFKAPTVLCVHLKRFQFANTFGGKINKSIQFGERLSLEAHMSDRASNPGYSLYAVLVHSGHSIHAGHYYCYVKSSSGQWHCMDDSSVRQVGLQHVLEQRAYMLFYVRDRIETLPVAAPSPAPSPSLSAAANAAAAKKIATLNLDAPAKKPLAAVAEHVAQVKKPVAPVPVQVKKPVASESDDDDDSYSEGDSDEEEDAPMAPAVEDEDEASEEPSDDDDEMMMDEDSEEESLGSEYDHPAPPSNYDRLVSALRRNEMKRSIGLLPSFGGMPTFTVPRRLLGMSLLESTEARTHREEREESARQYQAYLQEQGHDEDDEEEEEDEDDAVSRKRKRFLEKMADEVADLSDDEDIHEDEEIESSEDEEDELPTPPPQPKVAPRPDANSAPKRSKHSNESTATTTTAASPKMNGVAHAPTPAAAPVATPKKAAPAPFYFSAEAEAAAANGTFTPAKVAVPASLPVAKATPKPTTAAPKATPAPAAAVAAPTFENGPIVLSREAFDPRLLTRQYKETQFGTPVSDWDSTALSQEETSQKYLMKRKQDIANAKLTPKIKEKSQWDQELDAGHVRKIRNRDSLGAAGTSASGDNLFQTAQNAKNRTKDAIRSGEAPPEKEREKKRGASRGLASKGLTSHRERNLKKKAGGGGKNAPRGLRDF